MNYRSRNTFRVLLENQKISFTQNNVSIQVIKAKLKISNEKLIFNPKDVHIFYKITKVRLYILFRVSLFISKLIWLKESMDDHIICM